MSGDLVGLPVREPERYVNRAELAKLMGVSTSTIDRLVSEGMPSETWGLRSRRFRPSTALAWARARGHHEAPAQTMTEDPMEVTTDAA